MTATVQFSAQSAIETMVRTRSVPSGGTGWPFEAALDAARPAPEPRVDRRPDRKPDAAPSGPSADRTETQDEDDETATRRNTDEDRAAHTDPERTVNAHPETPQSRERHVAPHPSVAPPDQPQISVVETAPGDHESITPVVDAPQPISTDAVPGHTTDTAALPQAPVTGTLEQNPQSEIALPGEGEPLIEVDTSSQALPTDVETLRSTVSNQTQVPASMPSDAAAARPAAGAGTGSQPSAPNAPAPATDPLPDPGIEPELMADGEGPTGRSTGPDRSFGATLGGAHTTGAAQSAVPQMAMAAAALPPAMAQQAALQQNAAASVAPVEIGISPGGDGIDIDLDNAGLSPRNQGGAAAGTGAKSGRAGPSGGTPLRMDAIALRINQAVRSGETRFQIQLDPPELGRIDVKLDIAKDGQIRASLSADRPETLDLLQRDARALHKALESAGLKLENGALDFSLRDDGTGQSNAGDDRADQPAGTAGPQSADDDAAVPELLSGANLRAALGGIDRMI